MCSKNQKFALLALLLLVVSAAYFLSRTRLNQGGKTDNMQNASELNITPATSTPVVPTEPVNPDELTWTTYVDPEGRFAFKYPDNWLLEHSKAPGGYVAVSASYYQAIMSGVVPLKEVYVNTIPNPQRLTVKDVFNNFDDISRLWFESYAYQTTTINGRQAYVFPDTNKHPGTNWGSAYVSTETIVDCSDRIITIQFNYTDNIDVQVVERLTASLTCE